MPTTERHIRIHAPIERVWEVLVDVPGQPRWMRDLRDITFQTPGPLAVGTIAIGTVHMFGLSQSDPIEVTALDAPHRYAIRHLGGFRGWGEFRLVPFPPEREAIDIGDYYSDYTRAEVTLGWAPRIGLAEGLTRTLAYFKESGAQYL